MGQLNFESGWQWGYWLAPWRKTQRLIEVMGGASPGVWQWLMILKNARMLNENMSMVDDHDYQSMMIVAL